VSVDLVVIMSFNKTTFRLHVALLLIVQNTDVTYIV